MSQLANRVMYASSKRSRREMHFFEEGAAENHETGKVKWKVKNAGK